MILYNLNNLYLTHDREQTTASTGRIQCRHPNLQNIPKQPVMVEVEGNGEPHYLGLLYSHYIVGSTVLIGIVWFI